MSLEEERRCKEELMVSDIFRIVIQQFSEYKTNTHTYTPIPHTPVCVSIHFYMFMFDCNGRTAGGGIGGGVRNKKKKIEKNKYKSSCILCAYKIIRK